MLGVLAFIFPGRRSDEAPEGSLPLPPRHVQSSLKTGPSSYFSSPDPIPVAAPSAGDPQTFSSLPGSIGIPLGTQASPNPPPLEPATLQAVLGEARHRVEPLTEQAAGLEENAGVAYFAWNPGQKIAARFLQDGMRLESGAGGTWQATFRLIGIGYERKTLPPGVTHIRASGRRMEYHRGPLVEWYINEDRGLDQGWTLSSRPAGQREGDPLLIELSVDGVVPEPETDGHGAVAALIFRDEGGRPVMRYAEAAAWDAEGSPVECRMQATDRGVLLAVHDSQARYPLTIDPLITSLEQKLGPPVQGDGSRSDYFGSAVSVSGDTVVIGAVNDYTAAGTGAGSAYAFVRSGATWIFQAKLMANDASAADKFGTSVALDGDTVVIGAEGEGGVGSAYVFVRQGAGWTQQTKFQGTKPNSRFGNCVALSGNTVLIGAPQHDLQSFDEGAAFVYQRTGTAWSLQTILIPSDSYPYDWFGYSVALSGDTALVGHRYWHGTAGSFPGQAYVFTRNGNTWMEQAILTAGDTSSEDNFGQAVALSGNTALVGATVFNDNRGSAYVFTRSGTNWTQEAKLVPDDAQQADQIGLRLALDGDVAVLGSQWADTEAGSNAGAAYVFARSGGSWVQQAKLKANPGRLQEYFAYSVSLSAGTAVLGAVTAQTENGTPSGGAYVFVNNDETWSQQALLIRGDSEEEVYFGSSVSISGDIALVGVPLEYTASGSNTGCAFAFSRSGAAWNLEAKLTPSDAATNDAFGQSVALRGATALIGADGQSVSITSRPGSAYVYSRTGTNWLQQAKLMATDREDGDAFGCSVALGENIALVGAMYDDDFSVSGRDQGSVYVFSGSGSAWTQQARLSASDQAADDSFGNSVALWGETALVGAKRKDAAAGSSVGAAYVFTRDESMWTQQAKLMASDPGLSDQFGSSVALLPDVALVGSPNDDLPGWNNAGSVYAFARSGSLWTEQSKLVAADPAASGFFGGAVAAEGDTVLVGTTKGGFSSGAVYVFNRAEGAWTQLAKLTAADTRIKDYFGWSVALSGETALVGAYWDDTPVINGDVAHRQGSAYVFRMPGLPLTYSSWAAAIPHGQAGHDQSALGDGFPNLLKYATGSSPTLADDVATLSGFLGAGRMKLNFHRNPGARDVTLRVEGSVSLDPGAAWIPLATHTNGTWGGAVGIAETGSANPVAVRFEMDLPSGSSRYYLRLRATQP